MVIQLPPKTGYPDGMGTNYLQPLSVETFSSVDLLRVLHDNGKGMLMQNLALGFEVLVI